MSETAARSVVPAIRIMARAAVGIPAWSTTIISARAAVSTLRTRFALRLYITFRLLCQCAHRKTHLSCLGINLKKLDIDFIAGLEDILNLLCLVPGNLTDMEKAFLSRENLDECTELKDAYNLSVVCCADLRNSADTADPILGLLHCLLVV